MQVRKTSNADTWFGASAVRTFRGVASLSRVVARAWYAWLGMRGSKEDFDAFRAWADGAGPRSVLDPFDAKLSHVRWESLVRAGVSVDSIIMWLASDERVTWLVENNQGFYRDHFCAALWSLTAIAPGGPTTEQAWDRAAATLVQLLPTAVLASTDAIDSLDDRLCAAIGMLRAFDRQRASIDRDTPEPKQLGALRARVEELLHSLLTSQEVGRSVSDFVSLLSIGTASFNEGTVSRTEWVLALWERLVGNWQNISGFVQNNPWAAGDVVSFLALMVEKNPGQHAASARKMILEVIPLSASSLAALIGVLDENLWDEETWSALMQRMRVGAGGARGRFPGSWRSAVCDLVRLTVLREHKPLPRDLRFLLDPVIDLTANEDATVANHASYAIAAVARYGIEVDDDQLARRIAEALRGIAEDVRPSVRSAAAYALGALSRSTTHVALRELRDSISPALSEDPYVRVRYEWWFGERQAEVMMVPANSPGDVGSVTSD
jgi:hypothetical protein